MITFEHFVRDLGEFANAYSEEELARLHRDVQRFATIIIAVYRAREEAGRLQSNPEDRIQGLPL